MSSWDTLHMQGTSFLIVLIFECAQNMDEQIYRVCKLDRRNCTLYSRKKNVGLGIGVGRLPLGEVNNFSRYIVETLHKAWGLLDKYHWAWGDFFAGKENVAFPIKYLSVCKFWCYVSPLWCSDCWNRSAYYSHPWNLSQLSVKNVFRQLEIFPEVAVSQMHVHILTANYLFIFAWQAKWTSI